MQQTGYEVIEVAFLPHSQLRVGTNNAISATINGDRFAIYKCENAAAVEKVVSEFTHAFGVGCFVFRSMPVNMYRDPYYEIGQFPDQEIHWSKLVANPRFVRTLEKLKWDLKEVVNENQ